MGWEGFPSLLEREGGRANEMRRAGSPLHRWVLSRRQTPSHHRCAVHPSVRQRHRAFASKQADRLPPRQRDPISLESCTVAQLKQMLREKGLRVTGKKAELIERLSGTRAQAQVEARFDQLGLEVAKPIQPPQKTFKLRVIVAEKPSAARDIASALPGITSVHSESASGYISSCPSLRIGGVGGGVSIDSAHTGSDAPAPSVTVVTWALGHLLDFPESPGRWSASNLPIIPNQFALVHTKNPAQRKQYEVVKKLLSHADEVINACDAGREGELIFRTLMAKTGCVAPTQRLWISSLTEDAIQRGFKSLRDGSQYDNLFYSALARKEADWLVGVNATQAHTLAYGSRFGGGKKAVLSLGRVQTPVLRAVVHRTMQHDEFKPTPYWRLHVRCVAPGQDGSIADGGGAARTGSNPQGEISLRLTGACEGFSSWDMDLLPRALEDEDCGSTMREELDALHRLAAQTRPRAESLGRALSHWGCAFPAAEDGASGLRHRVACLARSPLDWTIDGRGRISCAHVAHAIAADAMAAGHATVDSISRTTRVERPPLLYDLTSVQKDANTMHGLSAARTLQALQSLYERHKLISYPRTSSRHLTDDLLPTVDKILLHMNEGNTSIPSAALALIDGAKLRTTHTAVFDAGKVTDHHALIPTLHGIVSPNPCSTTNSPLAPHEKLVYHLVLRRFVAAFMPDCQRAVQRLSASICNAAKYTLEAQHTVVTHPGWRSAYAGHSRTPHGAGTGGGGEHQSGRSAIGDKEDGDGAEADAEESPSMRKMNAAAMASDQLSVGDRLEIARDPIISHMSTTPPALYTEATLLAMMESIKVALPNDAVGKEGDGKPKEVHYPLGTPSTRAAILERLIDVEYVQRRGKHLVPTEKGRKLIQIIQDSPLSSAELTARWEHRLDEIVREGLPCAQSFMSDIKEFTRSMVDDVKPDISSKRTHSNQQRSPHVRSNDDFVKLGWCWKCKQGQMVTKPTWKVWKCSSDRSCDYRVFKTIAGKTLSSGEMETLLHKGRTPLLKGFKSKVGKKFGARVVLNAETGATLEFPNAANKRR